MNTCEQFNDREQAFYIFRRNLRHERKCWSIFGKVWLGLTIFFAAFALLFLMIGIGTGESMFIFVGVEYLLLPMFLLPIVIVNMIMAKKVTGYLDELEENPNPAVERCDSVGIIVLGAIFNTLVLIFVIQNFVHVKLKKELLLK